MIGVNLSRNFGQERALAAALSAVCGEVVLILDADLQDPPELLPDMLTMLEPGVDVVYGQRRSRAGESWLKSLTARLFYRLMDRISELRIPRDTGLFRLMRRRVVEALLQLPESSRYTRGMMSWVGFRQVAMPYDRAPRLCGTSHWPLRKMLSLAMDAICSFSPNPLRLAGTMAVLCWCACIASLIGWGWLRWSTGQNEMILALGALIAGFSGLQLFVLYVLGEYIIRLSEQSRQRPLYVVESTTELQAKSSRNTWRENHVHA